MVTGSQQEIVNTDIRLERVECPRCQSDKSTRIFAGRDFLHKITGEFFVSTCSQCRLWFQNPRPVPSDIGKLYPGDYLPHVQLDQEAKGKPVAAYLIDYLRKHLGYSHLSAADSRWSWKNTFLYAPVKSYRVNQGLIPHFVPNGKLLEIGCASGARLVELRKLGWTDLYGIELVPEAVAKARAEGFKVECGLIEDTIGDFPDNHFDVIITSMVVEHLFNPFEVLQTITRKLRPGGELLFSTIVHDSLDCRIYGKYWAGFDFPRHMVYFRKKDLVDALSNDYTEIRFFSQNAPIDFKRSSSWRIQANDGNILDKIIVRITDSAISRLLFQFIVWFKLTTRISVKCIKRNR